MQGCTPDGRSKLDNFYSFGSHSDFQWFSNETISIKSLPVIMRRVNPNLIATRPP